MTKKTIAQLVKDGRKFTIDGKPATILTTTRPCRYYPVAAETEGGIMHTFTEYGAYDVTEDSHLDLIPVPLPKHGYVALCPRTHTLILNTVFETVEEVDKTLDGLGINKGYYTRVIWIKA